MGEYESKLDCYRILAINSEGEVRLRSRDDNDFTARYAQIASALHGLAQRFVQKRTQDRVISAGVDPLALWIARQLSSDDRPPCLENPGPKDAESTLTDDDLLHFTLSQDTDGGYEQLVEMALH